MANEEQKEELITLKLTKTQLFQLHLCTVCRSSVATAMWTNATNQKEQEVLASEVSFLTELTALLAEAIKNAK